MHTEGTEQTPGFLCELWCPLYALGVEKSPPAHSTVIWYNIPDRAGVHLNGDCRGEKTFQVALGFRARGGVRVGGDLRLVGLVAGRARPRPRLLPGDQMLCLCMSISTVR